MRNVLFILLFLPAVAAAHGVVTEVLPGPAVTVVVTYGDGLPLAFEACEVNAPDDDFPFQTGRTDRLGRVVFAPDRPGVWRVKVTTADGHGTAIEVPVDADLLASVTGGPVPQGTSSKIITGIGVLLGVFGLVALWQRRQA